MPRKPNYPDYPPRDTAGSHMHSKKEIRLMRRADNMHKKGLGNCKPGTYGKSCFKKSSKSGEGMVEKSVPFPGFEKKSTPMVTPGGDTIYGSGRDESSMPSAGGRSPRRGGGGGQCPLRKRWNPKTGKWEWYSPCGPRGY